MWHRAKYKFDGDFKDMGSISGIDVLEIIENNSVKSFRMINGFNLSGKGLIFRLNWVSNSIKS